MTATATPEIVTFGDANEKRRRGQFVDLMRDCPIPDGETAAEPGTIPHAADSSPASSYDFLYRQALRCRASSWSSAAAGARRLVVQRIARHL